MTFYQCFRDGATGPTVLVTRSDVPIGRIEGPGSDDVLVAVQEAFGVPPGNLSHPAEFSGRIDNVQFETMVAMGVPAFENTEEGWVRCG